MMELQMMRILNVLRYVLLVVSQIVSFLVILGKIHWEGYLVQIVNIKEAPPLGYQMVDLIEVRLLVLTGNLC